MVNVFIFVLACTINQLVIWWTLVKSCIEYYHVVFWKEFLFATTYAFDIGAFNKPFEYFQVNLEDTELLDEIIKTQKAVGFGNPQFW